MSEEHQETGRSGDGDVRRFYERFGTEYTVLKPGIEVTGDIDLVGGEGYSNIKISCAFEGGINVNGIVYIAREGSFQGSIDAAGIIIAGKSEGRHTASLKIEIRKDGTARGTFRAPEVQRDKGCDFEGDIEQPETGMDLFVEKRHGVDLTLGEEY